MTVESEQRTRGSPNSSDKIYGERVIALKQSLGHNDTVHRDVIRLRSGPLPSVERHFDQLMYTSTVVLLTKKRVPSNYLVRPDR